MQSPQRAQNSCEPSIPEAKTYACFIQYIKHAVSIESSKLIWAVHFPKPSNGPHALVAWTVDEALIRLSSWLLLESLRRCSWDFSTIYTPPSSTKCVSAIALI